MTHADYQNLAIGLLIMWVSAMAAVVEVLYKLEEIKKRLPK